MLENEQLQRELMAAAVALEDAACDLFLASQHVSHLNYSATLQKIQGLNGHADRLKTLADEVKDGRISRAVEQRK